MADAPPSEYPIHRYSSGTPTSGPCRAGPPALPRSPHLRLGAGIAGELHPPGPQQHHLVAGHFVATAYNLARMANPPSPQQTPAVHPV